MCSRTFSTFHRINQMDLHRRPQRWFFYAHTCLTMYFASCGRGAIRFCSGTRSTMRNGGHLGKSTCRTGSISDGRCVLYKRTRYLASRGAGHPRCTVFRPLISIFLVSHYFPFLSDFSDFCLFSFFLCCNFHIFCPHELPAYYSDSSTLRDPWCSAGANLRVLPAFENRVFFVEKGSHGGRHMNFAKLWVWKKVALCARKSNRMTMKADKTEWETE